MVSTALQPNMSPIPQSLFGVDHKQALRARRDRKAVEQLKSHRGSRMRDSDSGGWLE